MRVFMTGATGFIGRATVLRLLRDGHRVTAWVRDVARARAIFGPAATLVAADSGDSALCDAVAQADAVINLAGEPIIGRLGSLRWTRSRRDALERSRIDVTRRLVAAMRAAERSPDVLVSASAVGVYGDRGDERLDERSRPGTGFAAELCRDWERVALEARDCRVVALRIGIVLGVGGGALQSMLPAFRAGLGGRIGDGRQYVPWVHLTDMVEIIVQALTDERMAGVVNAVAPAEDSNRDLTVALGRVVERGARFPVPAGALRLAMGDAAGVVLASQRVVPAALTRLGFAFRFPELRGALEDIVDDGCQFRPVSRDEIPHVPYLADRRPRYVLTQTTSIQAPVTEVFQFFSRAENLSLITPPALSFEILTPTPIAMGSGAVIDYRIALGPVPMRWRTVIEDWLPGELFTDAQHRGPYRAWWHEHHFTTDGERTIMEDRVYYAPPLGPLGRIANRFFVERKLREIFGHRRAAMALRFPCEDTPAARRAA